MKEKLTFENIVLYGIMPLGILLKLVSIVRNVLGIRSIYLQMGIIRQLTEMGTEFWYQYLVATVLNIFVSFILGIALCVILYHAQKRKGVDFKAYLRYEICNLLIVNILSVLVVLIDSIRVKDQIFTNFLGALYACVNIRNLVILIWVIAIVVFMKKRGNKE